MAESEGIVLRITSYHRDKGKGEQDKDQDDFPTGEPKFGFAITFDGQGIQATIHKS